MNKKILIFAVLIISAMAGYILYKNKIDTGINFGKGEFSVEEQIQISEQADTAEIESRVNQKSFSPRTLPPGFVPEATVIKSQN